MKPMLKYRGGKSKELGYLKKWVPLKYNRYIEPFFGGGALYFDIEPQKAIINDLNKSLMKFYDDVATDFARIHRELAFLQCMYELNRADYEARKAASPDKRVDDANENLYYSLRAQYNGLAPSNLLPGTLYYYINKTAYSGMIRFNKRGEYNVPYGRYKNFNTALVTEEHSALLRSAIRMSADFEDVFKLCKEDDFVFLDPPYDSPFSDYGNAETANGFSEADHRRLAKAFFRLPCPALLVIGSTNLTEELYGSHVVERYEKSYTVNIRNRFKANSEHILVMNRKVHDGGNW